MKMKPLIVFGLFIFSGCASSVHRGVVAMKINDREAHVGIGAKEIAVGEHIELYRNECESSSVGEKRIRSVCKKVPGGHGTVTEILNDDYAVVQFPEGTKFSEGDTLEKHSH